ncbi:MAG: ATP synthase F0 subunit B [Desulfatirhabdiaceae bacterium]
MKKHGAHFLIPGISGICASTFFMTQAFASEAGSSWRSTYDPIMKWVNFSILLFVIVKYAGPPLINFLRSQGREIERDLVRIEQEKTNVIEELKTAQQFLDDSELRISELRERILEEGRKRRQEIIAQADAEGQLMLESAAQRTQGYFQNAKKKLRHELLDEATNRAMELLPTVMTPNDREKMVTDYVSQIAGK